ncbi:hypothetical protein HETIRDRAFT_164030 [Heterobasidion irregulare TC 32-1]|uniref:Uncharacterized protein n=1 Tax=Heterobasidion irregulare (strain TC 32-1) TaxID=747525 RepID=W4JWX0_HETIT|nr:uncharacterized protein HETIRDRAFT_164030 [Heterobasidion irregulare TC 32-1]ETW78057.1 hypothetical protein HETIRDRAFT_164030 [Heterobasidion irregulare TC 32-1]
MYLGIEGGRGTRNKAACGRDLQICEVLAEPEREQRAGPVLAVPLSSKTRARRPAHSTTPF